MNLHQNVLNSIKTSEGKINMASPASPSALSSSSISSNSSATSLSSPANSQISAAVAAVQALLQHQGSNNNFTNNSSLAAAMQAAVSCLNMPKPNNQSNNSIKDISKLNQEVKNFKLQDFGQKKQSLQTNSAFQSPIIADIDQNLFNGVSNTTDQKVNLVKENSQKKNNNKSIKTENINDIKLEEKNNILNAAALLSIINSNQSLNLQLLSQSIKHNSKSQSNGNQLRMTTVKSISPNSLGASSCSDDVASESFSPSSPLIIKHENQLFNESNNKQNNSNQLDDNFQEHNNEIIDNDADNIESKTNEPCIEDDSENNYLNDSQNCFKANNKPIHSSMCSPIRSLSSQDQSRSVSPSNSDYHQDSLTNSTSDLNSPYSNISGIDPATLLAAQSLLQQQNSFNCSNQSSICNSTADINNLSFLSDAAAAALIANNQPNSVASLVASRKRRNDKELNERIKKIKAVPDDKKDEAYWERRRKNNDAAKRSRDLRRQKEDEIANRASFLEQDNLKLKAQITILKAELSKLHFMLYNR